MSSNNHTLQDIEASIIRKIILLVLIMALIIIVGTFYYHFFENISLVDSFFFTIITITTVGYSIPKENFSEFSKIFTSILILSGIAIVTYGVSNIASAFFDENVRKYFKRRKMLKMIEKLKDHIILLGTTRTAKYVLYELLRNEENVVLVAESEENAKKLLNFVSEISENSGNFFYVVGDPTNENTLFSAGIMNAKVLITTFREDPMNLFSALTAKTINPTIKVIARASDVEDVKKLYYAGADVVVATSELAGFELAVGALEKKYSKVFELKAFGNQALRLQEITVSKQCRCLDKKISECDLFKRYGITVIAIQSKGETIFSDFAQHIISENDKILISGKDYKITEFEEEFHG